MKKLFLVHGEFDVQQDFRHRLISKGFKNVAVLIGYELGLSKRMKQAADCWLNNPRVPREASGTSGMTAAMNGAVNFSTDDGWIPEFINHGNNGFVVPMADYANMVTHEQDQYDLNKLYEILEKEIALKGTKSEYDYYILTSTCLKANKFQLTMDYAKEYMVAFPNKPQGFDFNIMAARKIDTLNNTGLLFEAASKQLEYYATDVEKYKQQMVNNYYVQMAYYNDTQKDYLKAIEVCDKILAIVPNEPQTLKIKESLVKNAELNGLKPKSDSTTNPMK